MTFRVGATLGGWSRELRSYVADHAPDMDVVLVRDQRGAADPKLSVLCLDLSTVWVTRPLVDSIRANGVTIVGVFIDDAEQRQWAEWEVPHQLRADVAADAMVYLLETLRSRHPVSLLANADEESDDVSVGLGGLVAIGGPSGSGAREVAIGIADRLTGIGSTVLVDCDETGGTVASRIGYAEHPNLLASVPVAETGGDLARVLTGPAPGRSSLPFDVIGGLPSGAEWSRVSPAGVLTLLNACRRRRWSTTVAVTGPRVEDLRRWADRYGVSREIIGTAPTVIGVCAASPKGVLSFAEWLGESRPSAVVQVVVNKVPAGSAFVRGEVFDRLRSLCGDRIQLVSALPWDRRVVRAEWDAALVRRGPYSKALDRTVAALALDHSDERVAP